MKRFWKRLSPARVMALGFAGLILLGSALLSLPACRRVALNYVDCLYMAASAVCVTGLGVVDVADTFTPLGRCVMGALIQLGGLGVATIGAGVMLAAGRKVNLRERSIVQSALNLESGKGVVRLLKSVFLTTAIIELAGAAIGYISFSRDHAPLDALGISLFHAVASFNNAGFDILGNMQNLIPYADDVLLNLNTCAMIFFGGIGFPVILEAARGRLRWRKMSMHARAAILTSAVLLVLGAVLLKFTEGFSWLKAVLFSFSTRTAGFSTAPLSSFTPAGLTVVMALMFVGASPGSTGGGVKTTTLFALLQGLKSAATNRSERAFHYSLPKDAFRKAATICAMSILAIGTGTFLLLVFEKGLAISDAMFEMVSAFGTVGLSTGITPTLSTAGKLLSILVMFIGRLGPMTVATLWYFSRGERIAYPEGNISIG